MKRSIFLKILFGYVLNAVILAAVILFISFHVMKNLYISTLTEGLVKNGKTVSLKVAPFLESGDYTALDTFVTSLGHDINTRITIVSRDGTVYADSEKDAETMDNHRNRPEIRDALAHMNYGSTIRFSNTVKRHMLYVAQPVTGDGGSVIAVARLSLFLSDINSMFAGMRQKIMIIAMAIVLVSFAGSWFFSRHLSQPIHRLVKAAHEVGRGNFDLRIDPQTDDELGRLAESFNLMTSRIKELFSRQKEIEQELRESESVLRSFYDSAPMAMGIASIDPETGELKRISANSAAAAFALPGENTELNGRYLLTRDFIETVRRSMHESELTGTPVNFEYEWHLETGIKWLSVTAGKIVHDGNDSRFSYIIEDISRRKRMELELKRTHDELELRVDERTRELQGEIAKRKAIESELRRLATVDPLTGVSNRRFFFERLQEELFRARRYGEPLTVLMIDLDHFKRINDTYGHQSGDCVLRETARVCESTIRSSDIFGRLGGEEFGIVLISTGAEDAGHIAERLRMAIETIVVTSETGPVTVTASIGVGSFCDDVDVQNIMRRADEALYSAKTSGRNCIVAC